MKDTKNINDIFSERLREVMIERGYVHNGKPHQTAFANKYEEVFKSPIDRSTISKYISGNILPPSDKLKDFAQLLNVSSDYLLGLSEKKEYKDVQYISETIGLSEKSINILRKFLHKTNDFNPLDIVLSSTSGLGFLFRLYDFLNSSDLFEGLKRKEFEFENDITLQFSAIDFKNMFLFEVLKKLEFSEFEYRQQKEKEGKQNGGNKKKKE